METMLSRYARLLVEYCLDIQPGDRLLIRTTTLAEPLVREVFRHALRAGAKVDTEWEFREMRRIFFREAQGEQLTHVSPLYREAMLSYEAYLYILAPYNLREDHDLDPAKSAVRQSAMKDLNEAYFRRTADRSLKRNLCQFPTLAAAQEAGMSLEEYEAFVFGACKLFDPDPRQSWLDVRKNQQTITDYLNACQEVHYKGPDIDIRFSTVGRKWINSDGQTNMPSGEIYTSPVEDSVNGTIRFSLPAIYQGVEMENVTLWVKDGYIEKWEATRGKELLDQVFSNVEGARRFGEAAIGTNYNIDRQSRNILFDEKMGGTIHMAIGQSYLQTGGKNQSSIHWDMISDMTKGGEIWADGQKIYENGRFLVSL